jgi:hypothetical protein
VSKLSIVVEEADESCYWLELIIEGNLLPKEKVDDLLDEANQITAFMVASRETAKREKVLQSSINARHARCRRRERGHLVAGRWPIATSRRD